ncbi:MAG TPA: tetratricopeptide repeat protein [Pyrinomonadaceae bacterium]
MRRCLAKDPEKRYQSIKEVAIELDQLCEDLGSRPDVDYVSDKTALRRRLATKDDSAQLTSPTAYLLNQIRRHRWITFGLTLIVLAAVLVGSYRYLGPISFTGAAIDSVAVLPFESDDLNNEYLSDGLSESIINSLAQLPNLRVIPRSSAFRYKGKQNDPVTAGKELGVASVVTGRLLQRGENLVVSVELTDVRANKQLWGERYDRKQTYILSLQEDIARKISEQLRINLSASEEKQLGKRYTENTEAYQLYFRGRYYATKYTEEGFKKGIEYFSQAIAQDPTYALAYDGLAYCYYASWYIPGKEARTKGRTAVKKALELDPKLAEAHASLATIYTWFDYEWAASENEFRLALNINPNYGLAHAYFAGHLAARERFDDAIAEAKKAVDLEPLSAEFNTFLGLVYFYARRYDEAAEQLNRTIEFEPRFWWAHTYLARIEEKKGRLPVAIARLENARYFEGATPEVLSALGRLYALAGKKVEALKIIDELREQTARRWVAGYDIAVIYAALGEKDQAFQFLDKEYAEGFWYLNFLKVDPELDSLRSDPRFSELLSRVGF